MAKKNECQRCGLPADKRTAAVIVEVFGKRYHKTCMDAAKVNKRKFKVHTKKVGLKSCFLDRFRNEWDARYHAHGREAQGFSADVAWDGKVMNIAGLAFQQVHGVYTTPGYHRIHWDTRDKIYISHAQHKRREEQRRKARIRERKRKLKAIRSAAAGSGR